MPKPGARSVRLSNRAAKSLASLDPRFLAQVEKAIRALALNPLGGKKLKGDLEGLRSYRLGPFRIIYRFSRETLEIVYLDHRKDVYR